MARPKLDTPLVRPEAAMFVWRDAFLIALAEEPALEDRSVTVLAALRSRCAPAVIHAYNVVADECFEQLASKKVSVKDAKVILSWCFQELDGGDAYLRFPDDMLLETKLRRPDANGLADGFACAPDIKEAVATVRAFLTSVRLAPPAGHVGPWWLLQCSFAALLPDARADRFSWWREDWTHQAAALEAGPLFGRVDLGDPVLTDEGLTFPLGPVAPALPAGRPGEDPAAWAHRASAEVNKIAKAIEHAGERAGIVKDPRVGLDMRPFRWAVLARCSGLSAQTIAADAGLTGQAVAKAVAQVEERVGLSSRNTR